MKPIDVAKAVFYPLTQSSVLVPVAVLWLLMSLARWAGLMGLFLMLLVIPAVFRYQMILLEARAEGRVPAIPDADYFNWYSNAWSLFPVPLVLLAGWAVTVVDASFGTAVTLMVLLLTSVLLPASFAVLAITHSPLQSLSPIAIGRLLKECGGTFWIASIYTVIAAWLILLTESLPLMIANLFTMLLISSVFSLIGSVIEPYGLMRDVSIPDPLEDSDQKVADDLEKARIEVLTHAYGFISRNNRDGGFKHIFDWIGKAPDAAAAWAWFFERMMRWENREHALFFAQHYVHDMLRHGEQIPALKVIVRCRLVDANFRPKVEDLPAAVAAAESSGNIELALVLKGQ